MIDQLTEDEIEERIQAAMDLEEIHFFDDLDEPEPLDFWGRVEKCDHKNETGYYEHVSCSTPTCGGSETHCADCRVYLSTCGCLSSDGMSGWSQARRAAWRKNK